MKLSSKQTTNSPKTMEDVATVVKKRLEEELPVLRNMAGTLDNPSEKAFFQLPYIVHNLAVIDNRHIYMLLADLDELYHMIIERAEWENYMQYEKARSYIYAYAEQLHSLLSQELDAQDTERKKGNTDVESMQHVEFDLSLFFSPLIELMIRGYEPNHRETKKMQVLVNACNSMLKNCLRARESAYVTATRICCG